jgi:predicted permease
MKPEGLENTHSYPHFETLHRHTDIFEGVLAWSQWNREVLTNGHKEKLMVAFVSGSYFPVLGIDARIGRTFTEQDDRPGGANVAVLSYAAWQRFFGGAANAVGQFLDVEGFRFQVVGVAPAGFEGTVIGEPPDVMIPLHGNLAFNKNAISAEGMMWLHALVRLKPGVPLSTARTVFRERGIELGKPKRAELGRLDPATGGVIEDGSRGYSDVRREFSQALLVLMALVAVVLLIACANLATLLFVRGAGRAGEMSLRLALGASRGQLIRQWMTECLLIAAAGGVAGILLARWIVDLLLVFIGEEGRRYLQFHNERNWIIAVVLTVATSLLFGLLPALRASNATPGVTLKDFQSSVLGRKRRLARWVLTLQMAASLVLVTGAALFVRTLWNLNTSTGGVARSEVVFANVRFARDAGPPAGTLDEVVERLQRSPLFVGVSLGRTPLAGGRSWSWATVPGYTPRPVEDNIVYKVETAPGYFRATGIPLLAGRDFEEKERVWPPHVTVVSESFAKHYFGDRNPLGTKVRVFHTDDQTEIIGVARDAKYSALREVPCDVAYYPGVRSVNGTILARPKNPENRAGAIEEIRAAVTAATKNARINTGTLEDVIQKSLRRDRLVAQLSAVLGIMGILIAAIGLYGAMAYEVARRVREIGIRIALGANSWQIVRTTIREAVVVTGIGVLVGIPTSMVAARLIQPLLFEVSPSDLTIFVVPAALLAISALLVAFGPARRASRLDPVQSIRCD